MFDLSGDLKIYTDKRYDACVEALSSLEVEAGFYLVPTRISLNTTIVPSVRPSDQALTFTTENVDISEILRVCRNRSSDSLSELIDILIRYRLKIEDVAGGVTVALRISKIEIDAELASNRPDRGMNNILLSQRSSFLWRLLTFDFSSRANASALIYVLYGIELEPVLDGFVWSGLLQKIQPSDFGLRDVAHAEKLFLLVTDIMRSSNLRRGDFDELIEFLRHNGKPITIGTPELPSLVGIFGSGGQPVV